MFSQALEVGRNTYHSVATLFLSLLLNLLWKLETINSSSKTRIRVSKI